MPPPAISTRGTCSWPVMTRPRHRIRRRSEETRQRTWPRRYARVTPAPSGLFRSRTRSSPRAHRDGAPWPPGRRGAGEQACNMSKHYVLSRPVGHPSRRWRPTRWCARPGVCGAVACGSRSNALMRCSSAWTPLGRRTLMVRGGVAGCWRSSWNRSERGGARTRGALPDASCPLLAVESVEQQQELRPAVTANGKLSCGSQGQAPGFPHT
jgi:hypothetical protein